MANYVSQTSDKSKGKAKRMLLFGGLGFQYFYVGRFKAGLIRFIVGALLWSLVIAGITDHSKPMLISGIVALLAINLYELTVISLGKFYDNVGNYLRQ